MAKTGRGGSREGAGRPPGSLEAHTLAKKANREAIRAFVEARLQPLLTAQYANATGCAYMLVRHEDGTFSRANSEEDIDAALKRGENAFQILTQQPNQGAASMLLGYAADKPVEPVEHSGTDGQPLRIIVELPDQGDDPA